jgi:hypothetical protein
MKRRLDLTDDQVQQARGIILERQRGFQSLPKEFRPRKEYPLGHPYIFLLAQVLPSGTPPSLAPICDCPPGQVSYPAS